jgi:hypothetical protein
LYENLFDFYGYGIFVLILGCSCFSILISPPTPLDLGDSLVILFQVFIFSCLGSVLLVQLAVPVLVSVPNSVSVVGCFAGQIVFPMSCAGRLLKVLDFCSGCPSRGRRDPKCAQCSLRSGFLATRIFLPPLEFALGAAHFPARNPSLANCAFRFRSASC